MLRDVANLDNSGEDTVSTKDDVCWNVPSLSALAAGSETRSTRRTGDPCALVADH